ncbi:DNA cytosine methyltransferase [uncultured Sphingomonas sp.]|uniref:DNA cytosine methyltransferase n=1 Tax=uncultured Sphingomonas sp. TaxID=158754 RepID=UPI0025E778CA|nr:DNA cytosine methyltransferase [uncultured Sphingomonas sp.]
MAGRGPWRVIDLFAGPGGLAEGFAAVRAADDGRPFRICLSIEKEAFAHRTLRFRAFLRQFADGFPPRYYDFLNGRIDEPDWAAEFPGQWAAAEAEAFHHELGGDGVDAALDARLAGFVDGDGSDVIVIGGPPCQAYSVVGRNRNRAVKDYVPGKDARHFLYEQYIAILERVRPAAFVMENVKGMLSASVDGRAIFAQVMADLRAIGGEDGIYQLMALELDDAGVPRLFATLKPRDFLIRAEDFGVPQARHRVIVVGVRRDLTRPAEMPTKNGLGAAATVPEPAVARHVLAGLPALRSGLSRADTVETWAEAFDAAVSSVFSAVAGNPGLAGVEERLSELAAAAAAGDRPSSRSSTALAPFASDCPAPLRDWISDSALERITLHASRGHMQADLARYLFAAAFAADCGRSPVSREFPKALAPSHRNWDTGNFADRFRVQVWESPSTTVTSHISRDGHYFIHPDPLQCRALTVREAARLQTFPDNYLFFGNRTQQYVQVGNAVPPFLAREIGMALHRLLVAGFEVGDERDDAEVERGEVWEGKLPLAAEVAVTQPV